MTVRLIIYGRRLRKFFTKISKYLHYIKTLITKYRFSDVRMIQQNARIGVSANLLFLISDREIACQKYGFMIILFAQLRIRCNNIENPNTFFLRQSWFKQQKAKKPFTGVIVTLGVTVLQKKFDGMITFNIFWYLFKISQLASSMEQIIQSNIHTRISLFRLFIFYFPLLNKSFYKI